MWHWMLGARKIWLKGLLQDNLFPFLISQINTLGFCCLRLNVTIWGDPLHWHIGKLCWQWRYNRKLHMVHKNIYHIDVKHFEIKGIQWWHISMAHKVIIGYGERKSRHLQNMQKETLGYWNIGRKLRDKANYLCSWKYQICSIYL